MAQNKEQLLAKDLGSINSAKNWEEFEVLNIKHVVCISYPLSMSSEEAHSFVFHRRPCVCPAAVAPHTSCFLKNDVFAGCSV